MPYVPSFIAIPLPLSSCRWLFLELLGFITFFGILLTQTKSYHSDLLICMLTVLSISLLCYVVADLDTPFSGFVRIDVSVVLDLIARVENMYESERSGKRAFCGYPYRALVHRG